MLITTIRFMCTDTKPFALCRTVKGCWVQYAYTTEVMCLITFSNLVLKKLKRHYDPQQHQLPAAVFTVSISLLFFCTLE